MTGLVFIVVCVVLGVLVAQVDTAAGIALIVGGGLVGIAAMWVELS